MTSIKQQPSAYAMTNPSQFLDFDSNLRNLSAQSSFQQILGHVPKSRILLGP
jgi:hypothetical protein